MEKQPSTTREPKATIIHQDGRLFEFTDLPCDPEWTELNRLGFTSSDSKEAALHLDDLSFSYQYKRKPAKPHSLEAGT